MNLNIMKCYKVLFSKNGLIYNISSYIVLSIIIICLISIIIFYLKDYILIKKTINNINNDLKNENINKNMNKKKEIIKMGENKSTKKKKKRKSFENLNMIY